MSLLFYLILSYLPSHHLAFPNVTFFLALLTYHVPSDWQNGWRAVPSSRHHREGSGVRHRGLWTERPLLLLLRWAVSILSILVSIITVLLLFLFLFFPFLHFVWVPRSAHQQVRGDRTVQAEGHPVHSIRRHD